MIFISILFTYSFILIILCYFFRFKRDVFFTIFEVASVLIFLILITYRPYSLADTINYVNAFKLSTDIDSNVFNPFAREHITMMEYGFAHLMRLSKIW